MHEHFSANSVTHLIAILATVITTIALCWVGRRLRNESTESEFRFSLGLIAATVLFQLLCQFWVNLPQRFDASKTLPFHVCDLVPWIGIAAVAFKWRWAKALTYFWGIGLCIWAFLMPALDKGPATVEFWLFWVGHAQIMILVAYLLLVRNYRPDLPDLLIACGALVLFALVAVPLNLAVAGDYGYLGKDSLAQELGPWPQRIGVLLVVEIVIFAALLAPWSIARWISHRKHAKNHSGS